MNLLVVLTWHHVATADIIPLQILSRKMARIVTSIFNRAHSNISKGHTATILVIMPPFLTCAQILNRVSINICVWDVQKTLATRCRVYTSLDRIKILLRIASANVLRWSRIIICGWWLAHYLSSEPTIITPRSSSKTLPTLPKRLLIYLSWNNLRRIIYTIWIFLNKMTASLLELVLALITVILRIWLLRVVIITWRWTKILILLRSLLLLNAKIRVILILVVLMIIHLCIYFICI